MWRSRPVGSGRGAATDAERRSLDCLTDRPSRPKRSPAQVPEGEARKICERRTVSREAPQGTGVESRRRRLSNSEGEMKAR